MCTHTHLPLPSSHTHCISPCILSLYHACSSCAWHAHLLLPSSLYFQHSLTLPSHLPPHQTPTPPAAFPRSLPSWFMWQFPCLTLIFHALHCLPGGGAGTFLCCRLTGITTVKKDRHGLCGTILGIWFVNSTILPNTGWWAWRQKNLVYCLCCEFSTCHHPHPLPAAPSCFVAV